MKTRLDLHDLLINLLLPEDIRLLREAGEHLTEEQEAIALEAASRVYFQPPENFKLKFPCIVYRIAKPNVMHADNKKYSRIQQYEITHINADPDNTIKDKIEELPYCEFSRFFTNGNMNHYLYNLYF